MNISEKLSVHNYFEVVNIFTAANRRRYADVEYISELLAGMIDGIQDKKKTLDDFYIAYSKWDKQHRDEIIGRFNAVTDELKAIFNESLNIATTRFRQKADFYTLFLVIDEFISSGQSAREKNLQPLRDDLRLLDDSIRPESEIDMCSEYAIKCVSQANSASSRNWRKVFLNAILRGTFTKTHSEESGKIIYRLMDEFRAEDLSGMCPPLDLQCPICGEQIADDPHNNTLAWHRSEEVHQLSNVEWLHRNCAYDQDEWSLLKRPDNDQPSFL